MKKDKVIKNEKEIKSDQKNVQNEQEQKPGQTLEEPQNEEEIDEEEMMQKLFGFGNFDSTKVKFKKKKCLTFEGKKPC